MNMLVLKRIVKYLKKDIITFILSLILSIIVVGCTIYIPILTNNAFLMFSPFSSGECVKESKSL